MTGRQEEWPKGLAHPVKDGQGNRRNKSLKIFDLA
jgi:hypothetical protein